MSTTQTIHRALNAYAPFQPWNTSTRGQVQSDPSREDIDQTNNLGVDAEPSFVPPQPTHDEIARRAYAIYVSHGRTQGCSEQDWQQAEEELAGVLETPAPCTAASFHD